MDRDAELLGAQLRVFSLGRSDGRDRVVADVFDLALAALGPSDVEIPDANDGHLFAADDRGVGLRPAIWMVCDCDSRRVIVAWVDLHAGDERDFRFRHGFPQKGNTAQRGRAGFQLATKKLSATEFGNQPSFCGLFR